MACRHAHPPSPLPARPAGLYDVYGPNPRNRETGAYVTSGELLPGPLCLLPASCLATPVACWCEHAAGLRWVSPAAAAVSAVHPTALTCLPLAGCAPAPADAFLKIEGTGVKGSMAATVVKFAAKGAVWVVVRGSGQRSSAQLLS